MVSLLLSLTIAISIFGICAYLESKRLPGIEIGFATVAASIIAIGFSATSNPIVGLCVFPLFWFVFFGMARS